MPHITIHINTDNITPDELEKLHRDITHIKSLLFNIVRRALRLQIPIESVGRALRDLPYKPIVDRDLRDLPTKLIAQAVSNTDLEPIFRQTLRAIPAKPSVGEISNPDLEPIAQAVSKTDLEPIAQAVSNPNVIHIVDRATTTPPLHTSQFQPNRIELFGRRSFQTSQSPTSIQTEIQQQTHALQQQTTILEQQIPILETIRQVKRSITNIPLHEGQTQHIAPSVAEDTHHQPTRHLTDITHMQQAFINTIAKVPNDLLNATYEALITIPAQTQKALLQLKIETEQDIAQINDSAVLSAQEKAARIEQIERNAAQRRKQIEAEANREKIASFNKVVANFVRGIGRMIAEQVKLRIASQILRAQQAIVPFFSTHPVLSIGAAALFSSSFDDPINDALAQQAGIRQAQQRATALGRRSAIDLKQHFEMGFVRETERHTVSTQRTENTTPIVKNEVKLIIGGQELKAIYEETQRQIEMGVISI